MLNKYKEKNELLPDINIPFTSLKRYLFNQNLELTIISQLHNFFKYMNITYPWTLQGTNVDNYKTFWNASEDRKWIWMRLNLILIAMKLD